MGSWGIPNTTEKAILLERLMASPLNASRALDELYDIVGNDTLWDMLGEVKDKDDTADVRSLVAAHVEELTRWSIASDFAEPWESGVRTRLEFLVSTFNDQDLPPMEMLVVEDDRTGMEAAIHVTSTLHDLGDDQHIYKGERIAPGVYAILDLEEDRLYRVECRYGLMSEAREEIKDGLVQEFFCQVPAMRMN